MQLERALDVIKNKENTMSKFEAVSSTLVPAIELVKGASEVRLLVSRLILRAAKSNPQVNNIAKAVASVLSTLSQVSRAS